MKNDMLNQLRIEPEARKRSGSSGLLIVAGVVLITLVSAYFAWPRASDDKRVINTRKTTDTTTAGSDNTTASGQPASPAKPGATPSKAAASTQTSSRPSTATTPPPARGPAGEPLLTVTGYIVNRERIELSPRFMGVVKWIGVKKGDAVTNGQTVVLLDDSEYRARLAEVEGRAASARIGVERAELNYRRVQELATRGIETQQVLDDNRLNLAAARAAVQEIEGAAELLRTYIGWTVIKSPIDGVVLEKLVDPNELVVPQSFGGGRGPSTALMAVADPKDLQVEIDLNESDLAKVKLNQKCRVYPEAFAGKTYDGYVAEMAPEASRQKGTLQVKVQIRDPDRYLTPELTARVEFLGD